MTDEITRAAELGAAERWARDAMNGTVPSHLVTLLSEYDRRGEELAGYDAQAQKWVHNELARLRRQRDAVLALADGWESATSLLMPPVVAGLIRQALGGGS